MEWFVLRIACLFCLVIVMGCNNATKPTSDDSAPVPQLSGPPITPKRPFATPDPKPGPVEPAPVDPPAKAKGASDKSTKAIAALGKLGVFVSAETWEVDLSSAKDVDQAIKLVADLDHVYEFRLGEKGTDAHLATLLKLKELRKLNLNFNELITDVGLENLKKLPQLRHLELMYLMKMTPAGLANIAGLSNLEQLHLTGNELGELGAKHLAGLRKLTVLEAGSCSFTSAALSHLAPLTALRELDLGSNKELDNTCTKHLSGMTNLQRLNLSSTEVGDAGLKHLVALSNITNLNLSHTAITDEGLEHLAGMKQLAVLDIGGTAIKGKGLKHLAGCKQLAALEVSYMPDFTGEGLSNLAGCPSLTAINLSWTGVTDAGLADIKKLTQLTSLDLPPYGHVTALGGQFWRNPHPERFSDKGLKHIGEMTNLEWLYISGSGLTDAGLAHLSGLTKLKTLSLGVLPSIKGPGLEHLKSLKMVDSLRLSETGVTDETMKHVKGLTQLKSIWLPRSAKLPALEHLKGIPALENVYVPKSWDADTIAAAKKILPKTDVNKGD